MVATCSVTEWVIGPLKSLETAFSIHTEKYTKNYENLLNCCFSDLNYYRFCLYIAYRISTIDRSGLDPIVDIRFRHLILTGVNRLKRVVFSLQGLATW